MTEVEKAFQKYFELLVVYLTVDAHFQFYVGRQSPGPVFVVSLSGFGGGGVVGFVSFCSFL